MELDTKPDMHSHPLLQRETATYLNHPAICTATFFEGDMLLAEAHLRARFAAVLLANPWLGGTLIRAGAETNLIFAEGADLGALFRREEGLIDISPSTEYETLIKVCAPYSCGGNGNLSGHKLLKAGSRLCRLVVAKTKQPFQFVVIFSLSHAIADGFTYYEILNMMTDSESVKVRALDSKRKMDYEKIHLASLISPAVLAFGSSLTFIKAYLMGIFRGPPATAMAYYVDASKVTAAKAKIPESKSFVSTNDLITAHYMTSCAPIRLGMMTINYRPRCGMLNNDDAGNYEEIVLSDPEGHATAQAVRSSLVPNAEGSYVGLTKALPSFFSKCPLAFISSWAIKGTDAPFDLALASQLLHIPVLFLGTSIAKCPMDMAIVFRPVPKCLAVLYIGKQNTAAKLLRNSETNVLGGSLSTSMFPGRKGSQNSNSVAPL